MPEHPSSSPAFYCPCILMSLSRDRGLLVHLCFFIKQNLCRLFFFPTFRHFNQHNCWLFLLEKYFWALSLALGGECSPQAALPFAVTFIKSASPRSDVGSGSFFRRPAVRLMTRLGLPLCASVAAIRHCQQVGSLCPPKLWGNKGEGGWWKQRWEGGEKRGQLFSGKN